MRGEWNTHGSPQVCQTESRGLASIGEGPCPCCHIHPDLSPGHQKTSPRRGSNNTPDHQDSQGCLTQGSKVPATKIYMPLGAPGVGP